MHILILKNSYFFLLFKHAFIVGLSLEFSPIGSSSVFSKLLAFLNAKIQQDNLMPSNTRMYQTDENINIEEKNIVCFLDRNYDKNVVI
jgi:hypothetical protein